MSYAGILRRLGLALLGGSFLVLPADPAHAPGYVVLGRDVWATRIVLVDGVEVSRDVWYSHYAPVWGGPAR